MKPKWFVRGDADGFVGLFIDNLLQLLLVAVLCPAVCGLPPELVAGRILPAAAISVLFGNFFYSWQAWRLARASGREDVTALPYGINTVSLVAFIFLVMAPIWAATKNADLVWQAGVFACLASGVLELAGAFLVDPIRKFLPRAALLSTLAGVAVTFIAMGFAFQIFASPAIAVVPMLLIVLAYAGKVRLPFGIPAGFAAVVVGTAVAWAMKWAGLESFCAGGDFFPGPHLPRPDLGGLWGFLASGDGWKYFSVIFPMALFNVIGSLQSLESAEAAGDRYGTKSSLAANGIGSILAGFLGSPFPTTIYIGHPGWKAMGARIGYSALNGVVIAGLCFAGAATLILRVVPIEVTLGILIWIGVVMVAQAYQETPKAHALAVSVGLIPVLGAWAFFLVQTVLQAAGKTFAEVMPAFGSSLYAGGMIALNQGFLLSSMFLAGLVAFVQDSRPKAAGVCAAALSVMSAFGLIHAWKMADGQPVAFIGFLAAPGFASAYLILAMILFACAYFTRSEKTQ